MKKRNGMALLAILLVAAMLAGCGASSQPVESAPKETVTEAPVSAPEAVVETASEPEQSLASEEEPEQQPITVSYPLTEETVELYMWAEAPNLGPLNMMGGDYGINNYGDFASVQYVNELTNVHMTFEAANFMNASTLFNLHVASGDFADLICSVDSYYTGGVTAAYNEGVIMGLSDDLAAYAPNYSAILATDQDLARAAATSDGEILQVNSLFGKVYIAQGTVVRQDWLDRVNMEVPQTVDALHDVLLAFQSEIGCENPFYVNSACNQLLTSYDLVYYDGLDSADLAVFQTDGTVYSTFTNERYRDWLRMMHQWYTEGLIDPDFVSVANTVFGGHDEELLTQDALGVWWGSVNAFSNYAAMCPDENFALASCYIQGTDDGVDHTTSISRLFGFSNHISGVSLSTACRNVECALGWLDYWYSDEGIMLANYGIEGEVYEMVDGAPQYTDLILHNAYDVDPTVALNLYAVAGGAFGVQLDERTFQFFTQSQIDAMDTWTNACDGAYTYPSAPMTTGESEQLSANISDVMTHIATCVPQFIIGERDIETEWDAYLSELTSMGIDNCLDAYQSALDRYYVE